MTQDEMRSDADCVLLRYAHNEKVIVCLMSRFAAIREGIVEMERVAPDTDAGSACDQILRALQGHDLAKAAQDLKAALSNRGSLKSEMAAHGYGYMVRT